MNLANEDCIDANQAAGILTALVDHRVDWDYHLRKEIRLRVMCDVAVVLAPHVCDQCETEIGVMAIRCKKVCVDADYFIEMSDGRTVFEFSEIDRIVKYPSTVSLPSYAVNISDIQNVFLDRLLTGIGKMINPLFSEMRFQAVDGYFRCLCSRCGSSQDESHFILNRGGRFHPAYPESERITLYPANNTPLVLKSGLLPLDDLNFQLHS